MFLLDTNILICVLKGHEGAGALLKSFSKVSFVSVVTVMELYGGCVHESQRIDVRRLLEGFHILEVSPSVAERAGGVISELKKQGKKHRHKEDLLIAATALELGVPVVTANWKDFEGIEGLKVERFTV